MNPVTPFEAWLTRATYRLARDGAECVRAEIGEHYQHTLASGTTPEQAIAALGDPKQANRDYRRVFLTESEAALAPTITKPQANLLAVLILWTLPAGLGYFFQSPFWWTIWALDSFDIPRDIYPANTVERSRRYLVWGLVASAPALLLAHFTGGSLAACVGWLLRTTYNDYKRWTIFRKLAGKPAPAFVPSPLPGQPLLTLYEAFVLSQMTRRREVVSRILAIPFIALLAWGTYSAPMLFGALSAMFALRMILPCVVDLHTPARSRWFLKAKLTLLALAVILPPFQFLMPMSSRISGKPLPFVLFCMVLPFIVFFHTERPKIGLRRKLPVEEWPKELYL